MSKAMLHNEFNALAGSAARLRIALMEQIERLFTLHSVTLGVPMEGRVKSWSSVSEKIERKALELQHIEDLNDLVGIRIILLFRPDLARVDQLLRATFNLLAVDDASARLAENQFGYHSRHYILKLPETWLTIPSFTGLGNIKAEVQVRTLAQHIWAAASHKLQYKQEATVPPPLRRSIHRVSALLETIDLEFERLLTDRAQYVKAGIATLDHSEHLNVDLAESLLSELLPPQNRSGHENYAGLLNDLFHFGIITAGDLRNLLVKQMTTILAKDADEAHQQFDDEDDDRGTVQERIAAGVYFTHVGLARQALVEEFDFDVFRDYRHQNDSGSVTT